jgi:hypothetical protein
MAKKSRRTRPQSAARVAQPARVPRPIRPPAVEAPAKAVDFSKEYHYVIEDLKRVAIYAAGLFVLLIVLALILS